MKEIIVITPPDAEFGFNLSGVTQHIAKENELEGVLAKILKEVDTGLIVVDERLLLHFPEERLREIEHAWRGILVVLPSPEVPAIEVEDYAARLIRRAIGYHVRLGV